jgi:hypothetical protein
MKFIYYVEEYMGGISVEARSQKAADRIIRKLGLHVFAVHWRKI